MPAGFWIDNTYFNDLLVNSSSLVNLFLTVFMHLFQPISETESLNCTFKMYEEQLRRSVILTGYVCHRSTSLLQMPLLQSVFPKYFESTKQ